MSAHFVILDMEKYKCTKIIFKRPFLAIVECCTDVQNEKLSFDVANDHVEFNLFKTSKFPSIFSECNRIDGIDNLVREKFPNQVFSDPFDIVCLMTALLRMTISRQPCVFNFWKPPHKSHHPLPRWKG